MNRRTPTHFDSFDSPKRPSYEFHYVPMISRFQERHSLIRSTSRRRRTGKSGAELQRQLRLEELDERIVLTITAEFADASSTFNEGDDIQSAKVVLTKDSTDTIPIQGMSFDVTCQQLPSGICTDLTLNNAPFTVFPSDFQGDVAEVLVDFTIDNDVVFEGLEQFELELVPPPQVVLGPNGKHVITLLDNESVTISILENLVEATEGVTPGGQATLRLLIAADPAAGLSPSLGMDLVVNLAGDEDSDGEADYDAPPVTFPAGTLTNAVEILNVTAIDDNLFETIDEIHPNQQLQLSVPNDAVTLGSTDISIRDNESVQLELNGGIADVLEGEISNDVSVNLQILSGNGPLSQPNPQGRLAGSITAALSLNQDFGSGVTFAAGDVTDTQRPLEVLGIDDLLLEILTEVFEQQSLELPVPDNRVRLVGSTDVHVTDNESGRIRIADDSVQATENQPPASLELELEITGTGQGPASLSIPLSVNLPGNSDYSASGITFPIGDSSGTKRLLDVTAIDDALLEVFIELFPQQPLQLQTADNRVDLDSAEIRIRDNELATIEVVDGPPDLLEGGPPGNVLVQLEIQATSSGIPSSGTLAIPVTVSLPGNDDYTVSAIARFAEGKLTPDTQPIELAALNDFLFERSVEAFPQQRLQVTGADDRFTLGFADIQVLDDERIQIEIIEEEVNIVEGQGASLVTVEFNVVGSGNGPSSLTTDFPPVSLRGNGEYGSGVVVFPVGSLSKATQLMEVFAVDDLVDEEQLEQFYPDEPLLLRRTNEPILPDRVRLDRVNVRIRNNDFTPPAFPVRFVIAIPAGQPVRPLPVQISRPVELIFPVLQRTFAGFSPREGRGPGLSDHFFPWLEDHYLESDGTRPEPSIPKSSLSDLLPKALHTSRGENRENRNIVSEYLLELLAASARRTMLRRNDGTGHSSPILAADVEQSQGTVLKPSVEIENGDTPAADPGRSRRIPNDAALPE